MQRLLQGDVGSGKTVVALYALLRAVEDGRQGALMAPTETLAEQHFLTLEALCRELGVRCALLTSSLREARARAGCGRRDVVVGTHALIQEDVDFRDLAVAVVDEQHRFGVEQRRALAGGARAARPAHDGDADPAHARAHRLRRPRRLARSREPPANRKPIVTGWVTAGAQLEAYTRLRTHLDAGPAGVRRLPADRGVRDDPGARRRGGGGALRRAELRGYRVGSCTAGSGRPSGAS